MDNLEELGEKMIQQMNQNGDESLDRTIKESITQGYKKADKVLIPERVIVNQYKA